MHAQRSSSDASSSASHSSLPSVGRWKKRKVCMRLRSPSMRAFNSLCSCLLVNLALILHRLPDHLLHILDQFLCLFNEVFNFRQRNRLHRVPKIHLILMVPRPGVEIVGPADGSSVVFCRAQAFLCISWNEANQSLFSIFQQNISIQCQSSHLSIVNTVSRCWAKKFGSGVVVS